MRGLGPGLVRSLLRGRRRRGRRLLIQLVESLLVDERAVERRLRSNFGLGLAESVRRKVEVGEVLALIDCVEGVDDLGHFEDVGGNPGDGGEEQDVKKESEPEALAQAGPAALVFEVADHLEQFVRVVVDPSRPAKSGGTGRSSLQRTLGIQGKSQKAAGGGGLFCGRLSMPALGDRRLGGGFGGGFGGSLGLGHFSWRWAGWHWACRCSRASEGTHKFPVPRMDPSCLFSHFRQNRSLIFAKSGLSSSFKTCAAACLVQWFLLN